MATESAVLYFTEPVKCKITKLWVMEGGNLMPSHNVIQYDPIRDDEQSNPPSNSKNEKNSGSQASGTGNKHPLPSFKSPVAGIVEKMFVKIGDVISNGSPILEYGKCTHHTVMKDLCAECGADLREMEARNQTAAVAMVHTIPELMISMKEAQSLGKADEQQLLRSRKLVLLVDLDQTLIHTTNDQIPSNIEDVFHFRLHGCDSQWYHTRLRPYTKKFLRNMHELYELHICTFGSRTYAHTIAQKLDKAGKYFSHRILSRDECFSSHSKTANLKALFPCGDHMVVIIDDREDVWNFAPNLIHVRPYHFFQHTGDINAPPGLTKQEKDDKEGFDFDTLKNKATTSKESEAKSEVTDESNSTGDGEKTEEIGSDSVKQGGENGTTSPTAGAVNEEDSDVCMEEARSEDDTNQTWETGDKSSKTSGGDVEITEISEGQKPSESSDERANDPKKLEAPESLKPSDESSDEKKLKSGADAKENSLKPADENKSDDITSSDEEDGGAKPKEPKIHVNDPDDYLLYLEEILRTVHHAYYEMYDTCLKSGDSNPIPDMKRVLPYVRRKVLENVRVVFSGLIPTNAKVENSKPYLVAVSLGAVVEEKVTEKTTHVIAARLGTSKLMEAKNYNHIHVVTPDWLWTCAERWERVDERLYPLTSDTGVVRRKPPAHCTSPDIALKLASKPSSNRTTGKKMRRDMKNEDELLASKNNFSTSVNPLLFVSSDEIADMGREVEEDISEDNDTDGDEGEAPYPLDETEYDIEADPMDEDEQKPPRKRKREETDHLLIGYVNEADDPDNESLDEKFRRGEEIPVLDGDEPDDEDNNEPEVEDLEQDDEPEDSEWCLAGEALEREFLS